MSQQGITMVGITRGDETVDRHYNGRWQRRSTAATKATAGTYTGFGISSNSRVDLRLPSASRCFSCCLPLSSSA